MKTIVSLTLLLSVFWLINSGMFYPLLLGLGALSVGLTVWLMRRVGVIDGASYPVIMLSPRLPGYLFWLTGEIIKANLDVVRYIWSPRRTISPTVVHVQASQKTDAAIALYANSITMTPGTVTLNIKDNIFEVHALTQSGAEELLAGEMNNRVRRLEKA